MHTDHFEEIAAQLKKLWGGQTLATLRDDARRELNGTCFTSLRPAGELRRVLAVSYTHLDVYKRQELLLSKS